MPGDCYVARLPVDFGLDGGAVEFEECGRAAQRMAGLGLLAALAVADQLATQPSEAGLEDLQDRQLPVGELDPTAVDRDLNSSSPCSRAAIVRSCDWMARQAPRTALPMSTVDRLADVC